MITLKPLLDSDVQQFLSTLDSFEKITGPTHIVFPSVVKKKIACAQEVLDSVGTIYFAMKSTYSLALIKTAVEAGCGLDVSTLGELELAQKLRCKKIVAGGPKNSAYLAAALDTQCLISVDSEEELEHIVKTNKKCELLIRVNTLRSSLKHFVEKKSRFGIHTKSFAACLEKLDSSVQNVRGIHFHADGYSPEEKASFLEHILELFQMLQNKGHAADIINLGGAFREQTIEDPSKWQEYLAAELRKLRAEECTDCITGDCYDVSYDGEVLHGLKKVESKVIRTSFIEQLQELLHTPIYKKTSLYTYLEETGISLIVEPGYAISTHAGITLLPYVGKKNISSGEQLILLDGHIFTLSGKMVDHISDPIVLGPTEQSSTSAFLGGLLCREDDYLMKRKVFFEKSPTAGSILAFCNTGSYAMSYESCNPQRHEPPKRLVFKIQENGEGFLEDDI